MKIGIVCVAVNCLEYTKQTLDSIKTINDYEIILIDNGSNDGTKSWLDTRKDIIAIKNPIVSGLAAAWNLGIKRAIADNCDFILVLNNDLILSVNTIDNLVKRFENGDIIMVTGTNDQSISIEEMSKLEKVYDENEPINPHPDFSCFMINKNFIEKVGLFDENFLVAYFEDNAMHADIAMLGFGNEAIAITSATYYHLASQTIKNNPHLIPIIENAFKHNRAYFIEKYGCEPKGDIENMLTSYYKHPFNDPSETYKSFKEKKRETKIDNIW